MITLYRSGAVYFPGIHLMLTADMAMWFREYKEQEDEEISCQRQLQWYCHAQEAEKQWGQAPLFAYIARESRDGCSHMHSLPPRFVLCFLPEGTGIYSFPL